MGLTPKQTERKGSSILYFKQSETIEELLALMGAPVSAMTVMQAKIEKDWRNDANRKTNCDTANVTKAVDAAQEQLAALRTLGAAGYPARKAPADGPAAPRAPGGHALRAGRAS